jgi:uncharacterized protein YjiS (DUF1127 family)
MATQTHDFPLLPGVSLHVDTSRVGNLWTALRTRWQEAALRRRLMDEDPRTLADLGISRAQAEFEAGYSWRHDLLR